MYKKNLSIKKIITRLLLIYIVTCHSVYLSASDDLMNANNQYDDLLFNEMVMEKLHDAGYSGNFSFCGDGDVTATMIHQKEQGDRDSETISYRGSVYLKYLNILNKFAYGFEARTGQKSGIMKNGNAIFETLYMFLRSDYWGEWQVGFTNTAADKMCIDGAKILVAYEGPGSGDFGAFFNPSAGAITDTGCCVDDGKAIKIAWYSPIVKGFSMGASFTFNGKRTNPFKSKSTNIDCNDDGCWDFSHTSAYSKNVLTIAGKYEYGSQNDFNAKISAVGWFGQGKSGIDGIKVHGIRAYQIGFILGYRKFKVALGFTDNEKSLMPINFAEEESGPFDINRRYHIHDNDVGVKTGADMGKIYTIGAAYTFNKLTVSAGCFRSVTKFASGNNEKAVADIITLGTEYIFSKSLSIYAEYDNIITGTCDRARAYKQACGQSYTGSNRANMIIIGTKFKF